MSISLDELKTLLKKTPYKLYRDKAPKSTPYPYMIYTYEGTINKWSGSNVFRKVDTYQLSLFTAGTESDLTPIELVLNQNKIPYGDFYSTIGDENNDTITNFYTEITVINDG